MSTEPMDPTRAGVALPEAMTETLRLSQNEAETLCAKAARGAGMSWGLAEEAGRAAGWLAVRGLDGPAALLAQLRRAERLPWRSLAPAVAPGHWRADSSAALCPVAVGAALSDFAGLENGLTANGRLAIAATGWPLLLLPFLAEVARQLNTAAALSWAAGRVFVDGGGAAAGDLEALAGLEEAAVELSLGAQSAVPRAAAAPCATDRQTVLGLDALAMKTTVPPSEKSRADAGGAASDND